MDSPTDRIAAAIRERILGGQLPGGLPLRQARLAAEFGVSRIPVREALSRLEAEGLVRREHHRGCVVASLSIDELRESLEIRKILESAALRMATPRMTTADCDQAAAVLDRYATSTSADRWSELNLEFHLALYRPARMPRLLRMIEELVRGTDRYLRVSVSALLGRDRPLREHRDILDAARAGNVRQSVRRLEAHIDRTLQAVSASARQE